MTTGFKKILTVLSSFLLILTAVLPVKAAEAVQMQNGTMEYYSTVSDGQTIADIYHYSDS